MQHESKHGPTLYEKAVNKRLILNHLEAVDNTYQLIERLDDILLAQNISPDGMKRNPTVFLSHTEFKTKSHDIAKRILPHVKAHFEERGWLVSIKHPHADSVFSLVRLYENTRWNRIKVKILDTIDSTYWDTYANL